MTTALIHVGSGKAGSTTLQNTLFANRSILLDHGIFVPSWAGRVFGNVQTQLLFNGGYPRAETDAILKEFSAEIAQHEPRYVVFSSEFMLQDSKSLAGITDFPFSMVDDVRIIIYLREPISYYRSGQQQNLKATHAMIGPKEWRDSYRALVEPWLKAFGDQVSVISFQKSSFQTGMVSDFISRFTGRDVELSRSVGINYNVSEPPEVTEVMQRYFCGTLSGRAAAI